MAFDPDGGIAKWRVRYAARKEERRRAAEAPFSIDTSANGLVLVWLAWFVAPLAGYFDWGALDEPVWWYAVAFYGTFAWFMSAIVGVAAAQTVGETVFSERSPPQRAILSWAVAAGWCLVCGGFFMHLWAVVPALVALAYGAWLMGRAPASGELPETPIERALWEFGPGTPVDDALDVAVTSWESAPSPERDEALRGLLDRANALAGQKERLIAEDVPGRVAHREAIAAFWADVETFVQKG